MTPRRLFIILFLVVLAARLCHINILWAEESLPMATAGQMLRGKALYRDIWFDKPPLLADIYLLWGARQGWSLRAAGALYVLLACMMAWRFARDLWSEREAAWTAALLAFYLTFDIPSAAIPLAADLLMLAPHIAAVWLAWRGHALASGIVAGLAFLINAKGLFVLAACGLWCATPLRLALGFLLPNLLAAAWLWSQGALLPYYEEVWKWGRVYAGSTFVENPLANGLLRSANWTGFHAAIVIAAAWFWFHERDNRWRWIAWLAVSLAAVVSGWRFFPRYYFQLLPVITLAASRGVVLLGRCRSIVLLALLIPFVRFAPRYVTQAQWTDTAMDRDSREAARIARTFSTAGDTLLVWGFRPELYVYTGLPAATRFLESQPLTGVPADRHLTQSQTLADDFARANRAELIGSRPTLILDGLGLYNPKLAIGAYEDLRAWFAQYHPVAQTRTIVIYKLLANPTGSALPEKR